MPNVLTGNRLAEGDLQGGWYALYTRHQHEKRAEDLLSRKGFETFLPLFSAARRWKDRNKVLSLPLFPNYIFLHGGLERRLEILSTPGVVRVVGFAGSASKIPNAQIEAVHCIIKNRLNVEQHPFLKCGDWVRVRSGPLEGIEGILVRKKNLHRLVLSVELLQKAVSVEIEAGMVEKTVRGNWPFFASPPTSPAFMSY